MIGNYKEFEFYYEVDNIDHNVVITWDPEEGTIVTEKHCGRDRASIWSNPEIDEYPFNGFWEVVQKLIRKAGGWNNISNSRIGHKEYW